jgi:hypothetical protein
MLGLMINSEEDILLTGDSSISEVISCCKDKNIFYQQADWKLDFSKNLKTELPQEYYKNKSTGCGTIKAISMKSDLTEFSNKWDFRIKARPKMDAIFLSALERQKNSAVKEFEKYLLSTRSLKKIKIKYN